MCFISLMYETFIKSKIKIKIKLKTQSCQTLKIKNFCEWHLHFPWFFAVFFYLKKVLLWISATDLDTMMDHTRYLVLLSRVYYKQDRLEDSLLHLTKARDSQSRSELTASYITDSFHQQHWIHLCDDPLWNVLDFNCWKYFKTYTSGAKTGWYFRSDFQLMPNIYYPYSLYID